MRRPKRRLAVLKSAGLGLACALLAIAFLPMASLLDRALAQSPSPPRIVLVHPDIPGYELFRQGARLGATEVNGAGGVGGLALDLELVAESTARPAQRLQGTVLDTLEQAAAIARKENLLAVIGYDSSDTAVAASGVYDRAGIPFLATHAKSAVLSSLGFQEVFALQCNYADDARALATYAQKNGLKRFVVLSEDNNSGEELSRSFVRFASEVGGKILFEAELGTQFKTTERLLLFLMDNKRFAPSEIDAFFVASDSHEVNIDLIVRARQLGLNMPIMGSAGFLAGDIESRIGPSLMKGLTVPSSYAGADSSPQAASFVKAFEATYRAQPDFYSALGYDAVKLVAHAANVAKGPDRRALSDTLRGLRFRAPFTGVTGAMNFDNFGQVIDRPMFVFRHDGVAFRKVDTLGYQCAANRPMTGGSAVPRRNSREITR